MSYVNMEGFLVYYMKIGNSRPLLSLNTMVRKFLFVLCGPAADHTITNIHYEAFFSSTHTL